MNAIEMDSGILRVKVQIDKIIVQKLNNPIKTGLMRAG
jgi:hypothetical protein